MTGLLPALIPIVVFIECWLLVLRIARWRESLVIASVIWCIAVFCITEILSIHSAIRFASLLWSWLALATIALVPLAFSRGLHLPKLPTRSSNPVLIAVSVWMLTVFVVTLTIAIVSAPNNWDSMTYHLSRVAHWRMNGNVEFYPTHIQRQLYSSPMAEYIVLQFYVLARGADNLVNIVQWYSFVGCTVVTTLIAEKLGASRFAQTIAGFIVVTTPMLILQSTSTQNDLVCAFLGASAVYFLISDKMFLAGAALGLSVLTKATAGLFVFPFVLFLFVKKVRNGTPWKACGQLLVVCLLVLLLNIRHWERNFVTFGNPLGNSDTSRITTQTSAAGPFLSNIVRNLSLQLVSPIPVANVLEEAVIRTAHKPFGLDPDDTRNSFARFHVTTMTNDEGDAPNPAQFLLFLVVSISVLRGRALENTGQLWFILCLWAGFLLFAWRISWQPWGSRLHLPMLVLAAVPVAGYLEKLFFNGEAKAGWIVAVIALLSFFPLFGNDFRPIIAAKNIFVTSREERYFAERPSLSRCYQNAAVVLRDRRLSKIGILLSENDYEYPFWALASKREIGLQHWNVQNGTAGLKEASTNLDTLVTVKVDEGSKEVVSVVVKDSKSGAEDEFFCEWNSEK